MHASLILLVRIILVPTIESQRNLLATVPKALALDAASSSINRGEFRSAIELLEQGRAVLWSKLRGYRHPLPFKHCCCEGIINFSKYRSDAIILQYVGDPVIVPLPESFPTILTQLSSQFATASLHTARILRD